MAGRAKNIVPLLDRVLVQRIKAQEKTASGVFIPEKSQETLNQGIVLAVGKGARNKDGSITPVSVKSGDKVLLPAYGGDNVKINDEEFIILRDNELLAKLE